ncbi:MAG: cell envelope integrity protein TolA, partial [Gammaproteobacteria bacterium]
RWKRPANYKGLTCVLLVSQLPGGDVADVQVLQSSGNALFDNSVKAAVFSASPLPLPRDPTLFERELRFEFDPGR